MGPILDLAVAALTLVVIGSLAALAWTLAVSAAAASDRGRERVAGLRRSVTEAESRVVRDARRADVVLRAGLRRTAHVRFHPARAEHETET